MILKRGLSILLVASFVMPATLASNSAQAQLTVGTGINSNDPIQLILQAMRSTSPSETRALLAKARTRAQAEKLPQESLNAIEALIGQAAAKIPETSQLSGQIPSTFSINNSNAPQAVAPKTPGLGVNPASSTDAEAALAKLIEQHPEMRGALREISRGRLLRDASDLPQIIKERTNLSLEQHDSNEAAMAALTDSAVFVNALKSTGLIRDFAAENRALREKYDTLPIDALAKKIVNEAATISVSAGLAKVLINRLLASGLTTKRQIAGVTVETIGTFIINANLVLRLADLYGVSLNSSQQEVLILTVLAVSKLVIAFVDKAPTVQATASKVRELFTKAIYSKSPGALGRFTKSVFGLPLFAGLIRNLPFGPSVVAGPTAVAGAVVGSAAPAAAAVAPKATKAAVVAQYLLSMAASGIETFVVGRTSIWLLSKARESERELQNESFRNYLMSSKGEGFVKLLIVAMNTSENPPSVIDIRKSNDPKANFILNLARSTRVCSPSDRARFNHLKSQLASRGEIRTDQLVDRDYKILRFACDSSLSNGRYKRMTGEFMTFDKIPQSLIATLRLAGEENRRRMGEVLLQMQFLDGDQDPMELEFFENAINRILGFDKLDDSRYFDRMSAFIRDQGGIVSSPASPTGYAIGSQRVSNPYDLSIGYMAPGGPDAPRLKSAIGSTSPLSTSTGAAPAQPLNPVSPGTTLIPR